MDHNNNLKSLTLKKTKIPKLCTACVQIKYPIVHKVHITSNVQQGFV